MAEEVRTVEQRDVDRPPVAAPEPGEPEDFPQVLPERLVQAYERRRAAWTVTDTVAAWLIGAHLLLLLLLVGKGSFYIDDLRAQGYAANQPFLSFIMGSNGTHFAPLPRTLDWIQSRVFPLRHDPAVMVTLAVRLLLAIGFWRVLRRLFGPRPAVLLPLALLLLTPALLPATTYYRQSITILACTAAMVWAIDAHTRWVLYRHRADLLVLALVTAVGLGCYEKAAAIPVILVAVTLAGFAGQARASRTGTGTAATGTAGTGRAAPVRAGLLAALLSALVVVVFLVIYRTGPYDQGPDTLPSVLDVLRLTGDTVSRTMVPLLLGGPGHWTYPSPYAGVPALSDAAVAFCLGIALIVGAAALWRGPGRTVRALVVALAWTLPSIAIVAAGRFEALDTQLAASVWLWADLVPAFLLAGSLALLPWRVGAASRPAEPAAGKRRSELALGVAALAVAIVMVASLISSLSYASTWWENPTGRWIAHARDSLTNAEPNPRTLATPLPDLMMPYWVTPTFPTDGPLLQLLRPDVQLYDGDGTAQVMNIFGVRSPYFPNILSSTKAAKLCLASIPARTPAPIWVSLPKTAPYAVGAQVEVGLLLGEATKVEVTVLTSDGYILTPQRLSDDAIPPGPHTLHFPVPFGRAISSVRVQIDSGTANCVTTARVWAPIS